MSAPRFLAAALLALVGCADAVSGTGDAGVAVVTRLRPVELAEARWDMTVPPDLYIDPGQDTNCYTCPPGPPGGHPVK